MRQSIMICTVTSAIVGLTVAASAQQPGRDGLVEGPRTKARVAPATAGACSPRRIRYKTSDISVNTTSPSYAAVPQTAIKFIQGGAGPSCVIVRYSAMASASPPRWIPLRVVLDGSVIAQPGEIQYEGYTENISLARSFDFVFPAVAPGAHTVRVQWRSFNGGTVYMHDRTTIVQYR